MRTLAVTGLFVAAASLGGCSSDTIYTVSGKPLLVTETNFGRSDYYCPPLANGQYLVLISDFLLCSAVHAGMNSRQIFHAGDETNLRLIFPTDGYNKTKPSVFQVGANGANTCISSKLPDGTTAVAFFSHHTSGNATYDLNVAADSGTITVPFPNSSSAVAGSFDLLFGSDHVKGSFTANYCNAMGNMISSGFGS